MASRFVVNADDLGVSRGATLGVIQAHLEGVVTSASLAPTGADYAFACSETRDHCPDLGLGLHFTLSAGAPLSPARDVPLLVDDAGQFRWEFISLFRHLGTRRDDPLLDQIEMELEAQLQCLAEDGVRIDHIDSERHVHQIPGIFDRVVDAADRHGIPFVRAAPDLGPRLMRAGDLGFALTSGGFLKTGLLGWLYWQNRSRRLAALERNVRFTDHFASYLFTGRLDRVMDALSSHGVDGIVEVMVHPGVPEKSRSVSLGNPGLEQYLTHPDRTRELQACQQARSTWDNSTLFTFRELAER